MENLRTSFDAYFNLLLARLGPGKQTRTENSQYKLVVNSSFELRELVEELQSQPEFKRLAAEVMAAFPHGLRIVELFEFLVGDFFKRSKIYLEIYEQCEIKADTAFQRLVGAFQQRKVDVRYIAPIEGVDFFDASIDFVEFKIQKFAKDEIDQMFQNEINEVFYPYATVNAGALVDYWCLVVMSGYEVDSPGGGLGEFVDFDPWLKPKFTSFAPSVERALLKLVLFDWQGALETESRLTANPEETKYSDWFVRFGIPCVLEVNNNLLNAPPYAPELPTIELRPFYDSETGDELGEFPHYEVSLTSSNLPDFRTFNREDSDILDRLKDKPTKWTFIDVALGFLAKAFFSDGLEQLLCAYHRD